MSEVQLQHLATLPLLLGFTAITDHPRPGDVPPDCGPQYGMVPDRIPISFWSCGWGLPRVWGVAGFSVLPALSLFLSGQLSPHHSETISETVALYYTPSKDWGR